MSVFRKSILAVGTYHSPDGTVVVTPERLKHWEREARRLQSVGYAIPSHFDHSSEIDLLEPIAMDVLERKLNRSAQATVGKLERFKVNPGGQSAEIVFSTMTPKAKEVVENNTVYVSPVIFPKWKDGAGNVYRDVITSIDLVDHPVDYSQTSFQPAVRMGHKSNKPIRLGGLSMSKSTPKQRGAAARRARFARAVRLGQVDDEDKKPEDDEEFAASGGADDAGTDGGDTGSDVGGDVDGDSQPDTTMDPSAAEMGIGDGEAVDKLDSVLNLLAEFGVTLPDDTTDADLIQNLRVALTALLNAGEGEPDSDEAGDEMMGDQLPSTAPGGMPTASAPNIATMSVQQRAAFDFAAKQYRANIDRSIGQLLKTGRCTPAEADAQRRALGAVRLSLTDRGEAELTDVDKWINSRKSVPKGTFWSPKARAKALRLSVSQPPEQWNTPAGRSAKEINEGIVALGGKPRA